MVQKSTEKIGLCPSAAMQLHKIYCNVLHYIDVNIWKSALFHREQRTTLSRHATANISQGAKITFGGWWDVTLMVYHFTLPSAVTMATGGRLSTNPFCFSGIDLSHFLLEVNIATGYWHKASLYVLLKRWTCSELTDEYYYFCMQWVARPGREKGEKVLDALPGSPEECIQRVLARGLIPVSPDSRWLRALHWGDWMENRVGEMYFQ